MKQRLLSFIAIVVTLFLAPGTSMGQTINLRPAAVPNGISLSSGEQYHQRFDITFGGAATRSADGITITVPSELTVLTNSITATGGGSSANSGYIGSRAGNQFVFSVSGTGASQTVTIEFDVTTPTSFTGIPTGTKVDTVYTFDFAPAVGSQQSVAVAKHQNMAIRDIVFTAPDATQGDTTTAGGRFYKLAFSSLPDLSHRAISRLSKSTTALADAQSDVVYSFYISQDSSLIERPLTLGEGSFFTSLAALPTGSQVPLLGTRQNPRVVDRTFIREDFSTKWATAAGDSVAGVISLAGTTDNTTYYVYVLADPAPERLQPSSGKKGTDSSVRGAFSGGVFLGRSGPLFVQHPPEFVVAGWDYDDDTDDSFTNTGVVQIPSDIIGMTAASTLKDNVNITVDSGNFFSKGAAVRSLDGGNVPKAINTMDLIYVAEDVDNPQDFQMNVILSTNSGLGVADLVGSGIDSFNVASSIRIPGTDTLFAGKQRYVFDPVVRDPVTNLITSFVPEGTYSVYYVATDGTHRTVYQVVDDPYKTSPTDATLTVRHSPDIVSMSAFSIDNFDGTGDGDLDVITGIDISQMITDPDGKNLNPGPAQRIVNLFWGQAGLEADLDVDDNATIALYYSTRSDFRAAGASFGYTSGNSDGSDLLGAITQGNNDTHLIMNGIQEDPDGLFDDGYQWDIWNYVSPEGTITLTGTRYYIYGILDDGKTRRLESFTSSGAINFEHPPYARVIEPSRDITVTVDEPVNVIWEAVDVDNARAATTASVVPSGNSGRSAPNSRNDSPNIRILLTSADFGEVTTWGSLASTAATNLDRWWLANSSNGQLGGEIELNEGVDTAFVIQGNRMRDNLFAHAAIGASTTNGATELQTNDGLGVTYFVYVAVDQGSDGTVGDQPVNLSALSPVVRAPGRITFTGTVPANPTTSGRFTMPRRMTAVSNEVIKFPIVPDEGDASGATNIDIVDIFMTVDANQWEAVDVDASLPGIQPFSLGNNTQIAAAQVSQLAYIDINTGELRLDFIYNTGVGQTNRLTFFDGEQVLVTANLRAKALSGGSTVASTIRLDNSGTRVTKMVTGTSPVGVAIPAPTQVNIVRRAQVTGTVPLQGRVTSADTITFVLREVGGLTPISDPTFEAQDIDAAKVGVQVQTTGVNGSYTLSNVPSGRFVLTAGRERFLTGHDTLNVLGGLDIAGFEPTLDGSGVDRSFLQAGDISGYLDSTGTSIPDNQIDASDVSSVNAALFAQLGDSAYNTFADLNQDSIVNATDKDFVTLNQTNDLATSGIKPVFPHFKQAVISGNNNEATIMLKGLPETEVAPGETFDVTVAVDGAVQVRTYEFHLSYDPEMIEVADLVSQGTLFENFRADLGGKNENGELGLVNSILGQTPTGGSGEATLATIRFRAINRSAETQLALTDAMLIDVEHASATPQLDGAGMIVLSSDPIAYHDADGERVLGLILADQDPVVDFNDFVAFAGAFGTASGDAQYDFRADLNGDDAVDFADFLIFADNFGRVAVDVPTALTRSKPVTGVNAGAMVSLAVANEARMGELLTLNAMVADAQALKGYGLSVAFDATQYEFVEARAPEGNLLTSAGAEAPLFLVNTDESGVVKLASAVGSGPVASGEGVVAELVFRPIGDVETGLFDIAQGVVFDPSQFQNRAGTPGSLEVRAIPTEFALNQNFPNPFNPETTISYDLADGGRVELAIYNVMGQQVKQLVAEEQSAGRYRVVWDGSDAIGRSVASGVYFYRLNTTQFNAVRKLMLLK